MTVLMAAALAVQAVAAPPAATGAPIGPDVVVVGRSLEETRAALRACVARRCPPKEDIDASLAHAENQFLVGDFKGARGTLTSSRGRNKRFAKELPVPVAELLRVDALVGSMVGERDYARIGTIDSVSALKAGLPRDDPRISAQRLLVAAVFAREGRIETAVNMCDAVAARAAEMGWGALQGEAMFRAAALYGMASTVDQMFNGEAQKRLRALEALDVPGARPYVDAAVLIQVKLAEMRGDRKALATAQARARTMRVDRPILLIAPRADLQAASSGGGVQPVFDTRDQWVDLSYVIAPDGHVRDLQEIGRGARASGRWIEVAREVIAKREYVPLDQPASGPGLDQLERAVLVSDLAPALETRIRANRGAPRIQFVNLTARDATPPVGAPRGSAPDQSLPPTQSPKPPSTDPSPRF